MKISKSCGECLGRGICETGEHRKYNDIACQNFHKLVKEKFTSTNTARDAIALLRDMVKVWNEHGAIYNDSWYYERANAVIAQQHP